MKPNIRLSSCILLIITVIFLFSCNLEDFNLKKLADPVDIVPEVFAPLAYGTFKVDDFAPVPVPDDNTTVPVGGIDLLPVILNKTGTSLSSAAIDSVYLITHFTNETPCDMEFELSFTNASGTQIGLPFTSEKISAGAIDQKIQFPLDSTDKDNLQTATDIKLAFRIFSSDVANPILYSAVKSKSFTIKISFYAPVKLVKL
jgi:hypothetical protein